ncbi:hypothetical protein CEUSTIGMA_g12049.t1 [Chlamydomonas eustigma]|uniref:Uncharacterized protein n=1 Tax=Chlamydomonas eustigma TaxID=1157962 RepID=A0A250XNI2_9CHLO|nr:hypothetical protein CEUSTIGMA_g12049.t1 [Chlamydomonas eustigma]|eukprot:GAX84628.1 hypothetical protein CEUSTIGMA_g12049.t1 [Chlamydomonas eustigma]
MTSKSRQPLGMLDPNKSLDIAPAKRHQKQASSLQTAEAPQWKSGELSSAQIMKSPTYDHYCLDNDQEGKFNNADNQDDEELDEQQSQESAEYQHQQVAGTVVDLQNGVDDASLLQQNTGDNGSSQDATVQQQQHLPPVLTDTINQGLVAMHQRRESLIEKIESIKAEGLNHIQILTSNFLADMTRMKAQVVGFCEHHEEHLRQLSHETRELEQRLEASRALVGSLGSNAIGM